MKKRIGIVGEGPTDYLVLKCMIDQITGEENDYLRIQPEQNMLGEYGNGWKGVWNWCESIGQNLDKIMKGISPQIDMIVIQMDGDVARKEKEVHCRCATVECEHKGKVHPLGCETLIDGSCPVDIPCKDHENTPEGYRSHITHCVLQWLGTDTERNDIIITVPCDSTDTWIVAAFDPMEEIEKIQNPWEDIISRKKDYHGIRIPGHKKNNRIYQQLIPTLESHWKQVIDLCDSAKYFEKAVKVAWGE